VLLYFLVNLLSVAHAYVPLIAQLKRNRPVKIHSTRLTCHTQCNGWMHLNSHPSCS